jgi:rare lipoprotein A
VQINDRGPFIEGRIIDVSRAAAGALGFVEAGIAPVRVELVEATASQW